MLDHEIRSKHVTGATLLPDITHDIVVGQAEREVHRVRDVILAGIGFRSCIDLAVKESIRSYDCRHLLGVALDRDIHARDQLICHRARHLCERLFDREHRSRV